MRHNIYSLHVFLLGALVLHVETSQNPEIQLSDQKCQGPFKG
jgi:hypothetical protein